MSRIVLFRWFCSLWCLCLLIGIGTVTCDGMKNSELVIGPSCCRGTDPTQKFNPNTPNHHRKSPTARREAFSRHYPIQRVGRTYPGTDYLFSSASVRTTAIMNVHRVGVAAMRGNSPSRAAPTKPIPSADDEEDRTCCEGIDG